MNLTVLNIYGQNLNWNSVIKKNNHSTHQINELQNTGYSFAHIFGKTVRLYKKNRRMHEKKLKLTLYFKVEKNYKSSITVLF